MIPEMELELALSCHKTINDLLRTKRGENLLITIDSKADFRPALAMARAGECAGAKVMIAWHSTPPGYGKVGDPGLPDSLAGAISRTDIWVELNNQWLLYNTAWEEVIAKGRVRYLFLAGLNVDQIVRCIGAVDLKAQKAFMDTIVKMTHEAGRMRITTPAGTDVSFDNVPGRPITNELDAATPGPHFLLGQIGWAPLEESIEGTIVFDGSFSGGGKAELGVLNRPIKLTVKKGKITDIGGEEEARSLREWLEELNDERMYLLAHVCYGFNPGARLSGLCTEDERVWGSTEWGIGYQGPFLGGNLGDAVSHADGICLNSSVWLDDKQILDKGKVIEPKLAALAKNLGK